MNDYLHSSSLSGEGQLSATPDPMANWDHKDEWFRHGKDFLVTVRHHTQQVAEARGEGPHRWCVYAYIYPKHPHFAKFDGPNMWQAATGAMPLHCGASLLEYPMYEGKVTSVKVGADYNHLHDEHFCHYADPAAAYEVFADADELFEWLKARAA